MFILIAVTDSGVGLPAEDQPKLFEAFYTTKAEGMGMGLAISRSMRGSAWRTTMGNAECRCWCNLPVRVASAEP